MRSYSFRLRPTGQTHPLGPSSLGGAPVEEAPPLRNLSPLTPAASRPGLSRLASPKSPHPPTHTAFPFLSQPLSAPEDAELVSLSLEEAALGVGINGEKKRVGQLEGKTDRSREEGQGREKGGG